MISIRIPQLGCTLVGGFVMGGSTVFHIFNFRTAQDSDVESTAVEGRITLFPYDAL